MPNKKIMVKTMVGYAVTMVNCRFCIILSHKQYEWHISCRPVYMNKGLWCHPKQSGPYTITCNMPDWTCKDQSAPGTSSTFLSLYKTIISHLIWFFQIPLANYEPLTV